MEKRVQDYTQEILDTIRSNSSPAVMGSRLEDYHENDLADVLPLLTVPERCKLYRILDTDMLSDIFEYAESDNVAEYLEEMDVKKAASILSKMETDALAEVLQKLDKAKKKLLIELLDPEVRHDIEMIASFDEDEIGSRMTTNCIIIREDLNVKHEQPDRSGRKERQHLYHLCCQCAAEILRSDRSEKPDHRKTRRDARGSDRNFLPVRICRGADQRVYRRTEGLFRGFYSGPRQ